MNLQEFEMQFQKPVQSAGESQQVTEKTFKGSSRASPDVEDEAISTPLHPQPLQSSPRSPEFEDEAYRSWNCSWMGLDSFNSPIIMTSEANLATEDSGFSKYPKHQGGFSELTFKGIMTGDKSSSRTEDLPSVPENDEGSWTASIAQLINEEQTDEHVAGTLNEVSNRPQTTETASMAIKDTNEPTLATALPSKVSYTPPAQTNSLDDFVTDDSSESSTPGSEEPDTLSFSFKKQELLQTLMKTFYDQLCPSWRYSARGSVTSVGAAESTRSSTSSAGQESTSLSRGRTEKPTLKRRADDEGLPPGGGGDDGEERKRRPKSALEPQIYDNARKFACPFFKYDPNKYSRVGSCTGPGFTSVSRVKFVLP
jgi:hypothetical protein